MVKFQHAPLTVEVQNSGDKAFAVTDPNSSTDPLSDLFVVHGNGKVSIGIPENNLPGPYKLYVGGGIIMEGGKVALRNTSDWSDYVFEKGYKLMSLEETQLYIKKHRHLPGVPSAEEVVKNGIDIAKMDATLLKKIEEAMLHIFELKERIDQLEKENSEFKNKLK